MIACMNGLFGSVWTDGVILVDTYQYSSNVASSQAISHLDNWICAVCWIS